jgi:hypothetical protein
MGIKELPRYKDCWPPDKLIRISFMDSVMSRNQFEWFPSSSIQKPIRGGYEVWYVKWQWLWIRIADMYWQEGLVIKNLV